MRVSLDMEQTAKQAGRDRPSSRRVKLALALVPFVLGAIAGGAGLRVLPSATQDIGPAIVSASGTVGRPTTVVRIPLLGSISAQTHSAPLQITLRIDEIDPSAVDQALSSERSRDRLAEQVRAGLGAAAKGLAARSILGAAAVGAATAAILPRRRPWWAAAGAAGGALVVACLLGLTAAQFKVQAFEEPRFSGPVERAPQIIKAVQRRADSIQDLRSRFSAGASRLSEILALAGRPVDDPRNGTVAILHMSDVHLNPLGLELAKQLAVNFKVDAILDTGDLTSFGEPIEGRIAELIPGMPAPYLVVPGNHDSPANRMALEATPNVRVLHNAVADIKGLKIMGWADPSFTAKQGMSQMQADDLQKIQAPAVQARVAELSPDVLAVHNRLLGAKAIGEVPLLLAGHRHRQALEREGGTLLLEVGSTGATGLGSFLVQSDHDYEAQIIYFRDSRPIAFDYIRLRGYGAEFEVQRQTLAPERPD